METRKYYSLEGIDEKNYLYESWQDLKLGRLYPHVPSRETRDHAESLEVVEGEWVRLTGTLFCFNCPANGLKFYEVKEEK